MATKYFCDGCDRELTKFADGDGQEMRVLVEDERKQQTVVSAQLHLCVSCSNRLKREADPRCWARAPKAA